MRFLVSVGALLGALVLSPVEAAAECACLCVDGAFSTVCTTPEEAREGAGACQAPARECPATPEAGEPASYEAPSAGTENCRDAQVYDATVGEHVTTKVCDVTSGSSAD